MMRFFFRRRFNRADAIGLILATKLIIDGRIFAGFCVYAATIIISILGESYLADREQAA
jgi:hypothetical protein